MLQTKKLEIYPTSRAIREEFLSLLQTNTLLPKTTTIGEFLKKAIFVPDHVFADEDTRVLLLQEASNFANFSALNIDRNFFSFLKNSKYIFSFFEELAVELLEISKLKEFDTYADYHEHLEILEKLHDTYLEKLKERNLVDKISLPKYYKINTEYINNFDKIVLHLEGYLSKFELKLFMEISKIKPFFIEITTNKFNQKMIDMFNDLGFSLKSNHHYSLDLNQTNIDSQSSISKPLTNYEVSAFENKIEQIAFIKKKVHDFIELGISADEIIVILPNPTAITFLNLFDDENNFNFAMGFPYTDTSIYQKLSAIYEYYVEKSYENIYRLGHLKIDKIFIEELQKNWHTKLTKSEILELFEKLIPEDKSDAYKIYDNELKLFSKLLPTLSRYPFHKVLHLFLNRLTKQRIDDTRGGKITVLEILETRAIQKEAVIVIDFNEGTLPSISKKDLFLSTAIRHACKLPTPGDRENLQKYYYKQIFDNAKEVAISYLHDEQNQPSRFLDELGLDVYQKQQADLKPILLSFHKAKIHYQLDDLIIEHDFTKTKISATKLKTFLDCKRKYYFKYIKELEEFEIPKELNSERIIGTLIHSALKNVYTQKTSYLDSDTLLVAIQRELYLQSKDNLHLRFLIDIWLEKLKPFVQHEVQRFQEGFLVQEVEKSFTAKHDHLLLTGTIDRVDKRDNLYYIIDYKTGKIPKTTAKSLENTTDFQLQFYHILAKELGNIEDAFYYDLNQAKLVDEPLFDDKLSLLYTHLDELKNQTYNFTMTQDLKKCLYCPYLQICNRIL